MTLVVDASVAVLWVAKEPRSERANALQASGERLIAPEHVLAESASALQKLERLRRIPRDQALAGVRSLPSFFDRLVPVAAVLDRGMELAVQLGHPVYDCFYLALAEASNAQLATFDGRFVERLRTARLDHFVRDV